MELYKLEKLRKILITELNKLEDGKVVLLPYPSYFLKMLLFNGEEYDANVCSVYHKIDFSNIDFDGIRVSGKIFDGLTGVKINPQAVYRKDLSHGDYYGVEFIGPFDGVKINGANFKGSRNAIIDPQKSYMRDMDWTNCENAIIIGSFDGVSCDNTKLDGAIHIIGNPDLEILYNKPKYNSNLEEDFKQKVKNLVKENNMKNN